MADGTVQEVEVPYEIPDSWEWVRLRNLGIITSGGTPKSSEPSYYGGDIIWITPADLGKQQKNKLFSTSSKTITELGLQKSSAQLISKHSIVYSSRAPIGHINIVNDDFTTNQGCKSVTPLLANLDFLYWLLQFRTKDIILRSSGTTFKEISASGFGETLLPLPPLAEQKRIVAQIERSLEQVEVYAENYHKLQELDRAFPDKLKKSILQYAMQGKLVAQNPNDEPVEILLEKIRAEKQKLFEEGKLKKKDLTEMVVIKGDDNSHYQDVPYDIPESWKWVRLNNILDVRDGTHNTPKYVNEGVPLLTSKNLVNGKIVKEPSKLISIEDSLEINKRSKVDKNDILLAMIGTVGNPVLVPELDYEFSVKNVAILKHITELNMKFTYYFIQYHSIELKKISSGAVQNFVSLKTLRQILFPLPPLAEQRRIVSKISKIFSVIETLV
ncbi:restriction endonuclease subunit S [Streptococcus suis]|uniref:restriction endonuclease subunit S n=1 Tax=Streptococcus suis TaxID=1307 RepID=UPI00209B52FD|nr:restriction endonuclease subunit S [Streptococcus suis]MCO8191831.1 restriction endonuclease subunit S [Streptococcus suis]